MEKTNSNTKPLNIYAVLYNVITGFKGIKDFIVRYPFEDDPLDLETGVITFFEISTQNISTRQNNYEVLEDYTGTITSSTIREREVQIDITKYYDMQHPEISAAEIGRQLLAYISSPHALYLFDKYGYELINVWDRLFIDGRNDDVRRWCEFCSFRIKLLDTGSYTHDCEFIKNFTIEQVVAIPQPTKEIF